MPGPTRTYASNAARQRAYRARQQAAGQPAGRPAASQSAPGPGRGRWRALVQQAQALLATAAAEMQEYHAQRSEAWRDSERGETFLERVEALEEAQQTLAELDL